MIYAVLSDIHAHAWSAFSKVEPDGVNSRLRIILNEMERAASGLALCGGRYMIFCGDLFHTRGSLDPEVLNPVQDTIRRIIEMGITIIAIPGNHDLKSNETERIASAVEPMAGLSRDSGDFLVMNHAGPVGLEGGHVIGMVPWRSTVEALLADLADLAKHPEATKMDVFIHAGIDGVLAGMPDHGLSAKKLASFGFRRVFAGHYHHHADMGDGVYSVGALTHQTWSDVGAKAGFLFVDQATGEVSYNASHAPRFIDVSGMDEADMALACPGNYVRFRGTAMTTDDMNELRKFFTDAGALGTSLSVPKAGPTLRTGATAGSGMTLDQSVDAFVDAKKDIPAHVDKDEVKRQCADVLGKSRAVYEEA